MGDAYDTGHGPGHWGPWGAGLDAAERLARVRVLAAVAHLLFRRRHAPLRDALRAAESLEPADLDAARVETERLPALDRRKLLATYLEAAGTRPRKAA